MPSSALQTRVDLRPAPPPGYVYLWGDPEEVPYENLIEKRAFEAATGMQEPARERALARCLRCMTCGRGGMKVVYETDPVNGKPFYVGERYRLEYVHERIWPHQLARRIGQELADDWIPVFGFVKGAMTLHKVELVARGVRPYRASDLVADTPILWAPRANVEEIAAMYRTGRWVLA